MNKLVFVWGKARYVVDRVLVRIKGDIPKIPLPSRGEALFRLRGPIPKSWNWKDNTF